VTDITLQHSVQAALDELVAGGGEVCLQAAVMKDGALVAEAQSGVADPASGKPVSAGSSFFAGSTAKGVLSSLVHALVADGRLDYDLRLAEVWPDFAANGKGDVTVRHVLIHQAGVPGLPADLTTQQFCDWDSMCGLLAATPWWPAGTAFGYHAQTFGFLLGEVLQRATGERLADLLREVLTAPLGVADELHFAVPARILDWVVRQVAPPGPPLPGPAPGSPLARAMPPGARPMPRLPTDATC
jgi:CubicO group peptidase (beta-lactamase class C family)